MAAMKGHLTVVKKSSYIVTGLVVLLVGIMMFILGQQKGKEQAKQESAQAVEQGEGEEASRNATSPRNQKNADQSAEVRARTEKEDWEASLISRYGEARTNLSKHISNQILDLSEKLVDLGEDFMSGTFGNLAESSNALATVALQGVSEDLELSEEQLKQVSELVKSHNEKRMKEARVATERLRNNPESLAAFLLAGDAYKRNEMSEDEYEAIKQKSFDEFGELASMSSMSMGGGDYMSDSEFNAGMGAILDESQQQIYDKSLEERQPREQMGMDSMLQAQELDEVEQTIKSTHKMVDGISQMMEGMEGMQEMFQDFRGR